MPDEGRFHARRLAPVVALLLLLPLTMTLLTMSITGGPWELVTASPECHAGSGAVVCELRAEQMRRQHLLHVTVRATDGDTLRWAMTASAEI